MKFIFLILVVLNNYFSFSDPYYDTFISSSNDYSETKEVINKENKNGMIIVLTLSLVIIEIGLLYKKKKIKL